MNLDFPKKCNLFLGAPRQPFPTDSKPAIARCVEALNLNSRAQQGPQKPCLHVSMWYRIQISIYKSIMDISIQWYDQYIFSDQEKLCFSGK